MTDRPVIMVVTARITDKDAYGAYMKALVQSGLFDRFKAIPLATGAVHEALEGAIGEDEITALVQFPSRDAARQFWDCPEYRAVARLRETAGDFRVGLWRALPR